MLLYAELKTSIETFDFQVVFGKIHDFGLTTLEEFFVTLQLLPKLTQI